MAFLSRNFGRCRKSDGGADFSSFRTLDTMNILDYEPERLLEIDGIGRKKLTKIIESYKEKRDLKVTILKFFRLRYYTAMATKIYRYYGSDAAQKIEKNPYCLCRDIKGIGFRKMRLQLKSELQRMIKIASCRELSIFCRKRGKWKYLSSGRENFGAGKKSFWVFRKRIWKTASMNFVSR